MCENLELEQPQILVQLIITFLRERVVGGGEKKAIVKTILEQTVLTTLHME